MMNLVQLQEQLKDYSQQQLAREMQMPSGNVPQYLILGELQRRKRMESSAMQDQAQQSQTTVAQDAVAAAGLPQQGLGGMMQAMAPQTDMAMNTGQAPAPVQQMYGGGPVKTMAPGGAVNTDPAIRAMANRMGMTVAEYLRSVGEEQAARITQDAERRALRDRMRGFEPVGDGITFPTQADLDANYRASLVEEPRFVGVPLAPESGGTASPPQPLYPPIPVGNPIPGEEPSYYTPPERPQPMSPMERLRAETDYMRSGEGLRAYNEFRGVGAAASRRPGFRPGDEINITGFGDQTLDELRAIIADPNASPGERAAAQTRLSVAQGVGSALQGTSDFLADPVGPDGSPTLDMFADAAALAGRAGNLPFELAGRATSLVAPELGADILDWTAGNEAMYNSWATAFEPDVGAQMEEAARQSAEEAAAARDAAGITESLKTPEEVAAAARAAKERVSRDTNTATKPDTKNTNNAPLGGSGKAVMSDLEKSLEQDKWLALAKFGLGLMASKEPTLGGAIGEAGIGAIGDFQQAKRNFEEARLARATLAARSAGGGGGGRPIPAGIIGNLEDRLAAAEAEYEGLPGLESSWFGFGEPTDPEPGKRAALESEIRNLRAQINAAYGTYGINTGAALSGAGSLSEIDARVTPGG